MESDENTRVSAKADEASEQEVEAVEEEAQEVAEETKVEMAEAPSEDGADEESPAMPIDTPSRAAVNTVADTTTEDDGVPAKDPYADPAADKMVKVSVTLHCELAANSFGDVRGDQQEILLNHARNIWKDQVSTLGKDQVIFDGF